MQFIEGFVKATEDTFNIAMEGQKKQNCRNNNPCTDRVATARHNRIFCWYDMRVGQAETGWFTWCIAGLFLWFYWGYIFYVALGFISCGRCLSAIIASYAFVPVFLRRWRSDCCRFCEVHRIAKH